MTTPGALATAVNTALATLTTLTTYTDGTVPDSPPADATGRVYPYLIPYPDAGARPDTARAIDAAAGPELTWGLQVTVAAGNPAWVLDAATLVRSVLESARIAPGVILTEQALAVPVARDPDTKLTTPRWFLPLRFTCLTP